MRFAIHANDRHLRDLVAQHDQDDLAIAETWRRVGEAGSRLGLLRPGYHVVRRLVRLERMRRRAAARVRAVAKELALLVAESRFLEAQDALDRLDEALAQKRLVVEQHKPP